jgi:hypothetical protein
LPVDGENFRLDPEWAPEDREFKAKAQALLETLRP